MRALFRPAVFALLFLLAACTTTSLPTAINARLDAPGAVLDKAAAIDLINQYRATLGAPAVALDPALNSAAASAAAVYATSPDVAAGRTRLGAIGDRVDGEAQAAEQVSAGYVTFADVFSGWRNNPNDAQALTVPWASRAGIGVIHDSNSPFGTYWVLILAGS